VTKELNQGKFDVADFVGSISEKLIASSKADSGRTSPHTLTQFSLTFLSVAFDPKPFIRTFEASVDKLIAIRKDVQSKTEQMEKSVRVTEREYSKKMADLNRGFEASPPFHTYSVSLTAKSRTSDNRSQQWKAK
jgi:hypothetical protein